MNSTVLKIALQRAGRLREGSADLLRRCDIQFHDGVGKLKSTAQNFPLEVFSLRDDDIPRYVEDGIADIGIIGENVLAEHSHTVNVVERLGFGRCRLSIAVPKNRDYASLGDLAGKKIATSYPLVLARYLESRSVDAEIHTISGSVEIAPSIGLADAICDLVGSGSTLFTNGLREMETVMTSEAVLIARENLAADFQVLVEKLLFRIRAVNAAGQNRYILLNAPNERVQRIAELLPGIKSPTIMPLAEAGWSSIHSVVNERDFWDVVERLKDAGAEGILVLSIEKMINDSRSNGGSVL